jgi:hypothetical protein
MSVERAGDQDLADLVELVDCDDWEEALHDAGESEPASEIWTGR